MARWQRGALCFHDTTRVERPLARFTVVVERRAMATGLLRRRSMVVQRQRMGYPLSGMATLDAPDRSRGAHRRSRRLDDRLRHGGGRPRSRSAAEARPWLVSSLRLHDVGAMAYRHRSPPSRTNPTGAGSAGTETITGSGLRSIALICRFEGGYARPTLPRVVRGDVGATRPQLSIRFRVRGKRCRFV